MKQIFLISILNCFMTSTFAMSKVGESKFSWLFWDIYNISLWSETLPYESGQLPVRLEITYLRDITRQELIDNTIDQWKKQGVAWEKNWIVQLKDIWPDINTDNTLSLSLTHQKESLFYFNGEFIGSITDAKFSQAFIDIWLSEKTTEPKLRLKLLGVNND